MEPTAAYLLFGVVLVVVLSALMVRYIKRDRKRKLTTPALVKRARALSNALADFANGHEVAPAGRQGRPDGRPASYFDAESRRAYVRDYLPEIEVLREEFAKRGVREKTLDKAYEKPSDTADARTVSTALLVMAQRLR